VLIDRIYLRNYRVYEHELDLALPPGLVGVFGANGSGKSTLLEALLWALWGRSRTAKEEIRSAGSHGDCVVEVTFEHEGHIYVVRRTVSGAGSTVRAQAQCDGLAMAEGVRDTARYVHSVLGMDDSAFRASVFAEQKQVAAFSQQGPAERRKLVLALLGVTPLDAARDRARADARQTAQEHDHLRGMLPDLDALRLSTADAATRAAALEVVADDQQAAAAAAGAVLAARQDELAHADRRRQEHEKLVVEGRSVRGEVEALSAQVKSLQTELAELEGAGSALAGLEPVAAGLDSATGTVTHLVALQEARRLLDGHPAQPAPDPPDEAALAEAAQAALAARSSLGAAQARAEGAAEAAARAEQAATRSAALSAEQDCPLCGQALGEAFARVQEHRHQEVETARKAAVAARAALALATQEAGAAAQRLSGATASVERAREALATWQAAGAARQAALARADQALADLDVHDPALAGALRSAGPSALSTALSGAQAEQAAARQATEQCNRLRGRLDRRPQAERALTDARARLDQAQATVERLRAEVKALGFEPARLQEATDAQAAALRAARQAEELAGQARLEAVRAGEVAAGEARRLDDGQRQHGQLADLQSRSVHLSRAAELLNGFRNTVVASVGPRLAVQAADLFAELTDNEYDRLEVDAETYGLRIRDAGISYDLGRFSGSEVDLANLAMRVAISEHVRLLSGGTVGLLVLDEVFGPLDEGRRARMLMALERLRGRFRQVLVVTHSSEVKDQLPNAIEVVKLPGRRATARVLAP
jgi:DNA repair protein SbcC/Rad50